MGILHDKNIYNVPPESCSEREASVYELLDRLGIAYSRVSHDQAMTIADCAEIDAILGVAVCKNLLLCNRQQTEFYLLMLPGEFKFSSQRFSALLGISRVSFAPGEKMEELLGVSPGSLTVLGLKNDPAGKVKLVIERSLLGEEYTVCHPCANTSSLKIKTSDLLRVFLPAVGHKYLIAELS